MNDVARGLFTAETSSFILTDDLQIMPNWVESGLWILNNHGINGTCTVEEKTVVVGFEEVMNLLKGSLMSMTPLTDLVFRKTELASLTVNSGINTLIGRNATTSTSKLITVKAIVQKSTGKILLVQARGDFVELLFSFLVIPLGGVLSLLGSDLSSGSIRNLHKSLVSLDSGNYLKVPNPFNTSYVPSKHLSKYKILPVVEQSIPKYCYSNFITDYCAYLSTDKPSISGKYERVGSVELEYPEDQESFVKGSAMFTITDDLTVKPTSPISGLSILNSLKVPVNDTEERAIDIGVEEALSLLSASLFSKSALNYGLKHLFRRQPKKEK